VASSGADDVADRLWRRVRELAAQVDELESCAQAGNLALAEQARLDRLRVRAARAARRAELADELADQLAALPRARVS
jgi:hypothetical protein